ncbi:MAG: hypothetical protein KGV56_00905 [Gammaproteobacteria bacterium]|nr:hypothetical protein [Gammaproteobacteria bacterium]
MIAISNKIKVLIALLAFLTIHANAGSFGSCRYGIWDSGSPSVQGKFLEVRTEKGMMYEFYDCSNGLTLIAQRFNLMLIEGVNFIHRYNNSCATLGEMYMKTMGDGWQLNDSPLVTMGKFNFAQKCKTDLINPADDIAESISSDN